MNYRPLCEQQAREYPERVLIEHLCGNCGAGFSSIKPSPQYCSHDCYIEHSRDARAKRAKALWADPDFAQRILTARRKAGYRSSEMSPVRAKLRSAVKNALRRCIRRGAEKDGRTEALLGYTPDQLRAHLEALFLPGMTWANYGEWEIDHKHPIAAFPLSAPLSVINALSNLQPLWRADNRRKHSRVEI